MDSAELHSGKLTLRCEEGHVTDCTLSIPAFELLFDFGCAALLDDYAREAVTSFAASFERFTEFGCRMILARRHVAREGVDAWWKEVGAQSERQSGSFAALWISEFYFAPPRLEQKLVELRNKCVHKGIIPTSDEAKKYGEAVLRAEVAGIVVLRNCFGSQLEYDDFVQEHIVSSRQGECYMPSFLEHTVIRGMWSRNEPNQGGDRDEDQSSPKEIGSNRTDATKLSIDDALRAFKMMRILGTRR